MKMYHATEAELWWKRIRFEGIKKYDLGKNRAALGPYWSTVSKGIWLWPHMTEKLAHECFMFQRVNKGVLDFIFLECEVERHWLLGSLLRMKYKDRNVNLIHTLDVNGEIVHEEPFDICLRTIPSSRIRIAFMVSEMQLTRIGAVEERLTHRDFTPRIGRIVDALSE